MAKKIIESESMELSEETKKDIAKSRKEYLDGKYSTLAQVKKELGMHEE